MRALFVMDPLSTILVNRDSSYVLMLEWQARGGEVWHCLPSDLGVEGGDLVARAGRVQVGPRPEVGRVVDRGLMRASDCDVVLLRTDPPFDMGYVFSTYLLDVAAARTLVVNSPAGVRDATEKLVILRFPDLIPPSIVTRDMARIMAFVDEQGGRAIIKPWDGNGGRGIFLLQRGDRNLASIVETATSEGRRHVVVQAFVPAIDETGDKRILLVDGEPRGAFARIPPGHDHRGNMHVGASVQPCDMDERDRHICSTLAPFLRARGLQFAGIDVIGGLLTEVNVTSPTGIQECTALYGSHIEADLVDVILARRSSR